MNPTQIRQAGAPADTLLTQAASSARFYAGFSWQIFFVVLGTWIVAAVGVQQLLGPVKGRLAMGSIVILSSAWVFFDAQARGVPKPLRWGLGSLLLWVIIFPWYLARRRTPEAPCPFIEGEAGPLARALLFLLLLFFLVSAILFILKGPAPK